MNKRLRHLRLVLRIGGLLGLFALAWLLISPTGRYLLRAAREESTILLRREEIGDIIANPATASDLRSKLKLVLDARAFARDSLGLTTGNSFTTFSRLDHDTLVLVLSAAYRDQLKSFTWWFPVVGRVPYKGYFDFEEARRQESSLSARGFDAHLGSASAFSTLGWFNDPLLPTTLRADSLTLAETVIHELTHNTYYAPGGAVFNESFANFVGSRGAELFFRSRGQLAAADETNARWGDEKTLGHFWGGLYARVDSAFKAHAGDDAAHVAERIALRDSIYANAKLELLNVVGPQLHTVSLRSLERTKFDNGIVMSRRVYRTDLDHFDSVLAKQRGNLRRTVVTIVDASRKSEGKPFDALETLARQR